MSKSNYKYIYKYSIAQCQKPVRDGGDGKGYQFCQEWSHGNERECNSGCKTSPTCYNPP